MLEVRGVVDARREHDDIRVLDAGRGRGAQRGEELVRIVADGTHPHRDEQLGQGLRHDATVGDDVADARRHAHVVFEHAHLAVLVADQVDARHLDAHAVGGVDARGLAVEVLRRGDERCRQHAVADAVLVPVRVVEECLERAHALLDARLDARPLVVLDDARHGIQRERPLLAREVERHTLREVRARERIGAAAQLFLRHLRERLVELAIRRPRLDRSARMSGRAEHLVERGDTGRGLAGRQCGAVAVEQITHVDEPSPGRVAAVFRPVSGVHGRRDAGLHPARGHRGLRPPSTPSLPSRPRGSPGDVCSRYGSPAGCPRPGNPRARGPGALAGVAAVLLGAGVGELIAAFASPGSSPFSVVGRRADRPRARVGEERRDRPVRNLRQDRAARRDRRWSCSPRRRASAFSSCGDRGSA